MNRLHFGLNKVKNTNISLNICVMYCACASQDKLPLTSIYIFSLSTTSFRSRLSVAANGIRFDSMRILLWSSEWSVTESFKKKSCREHITSSIQRWPHSPISRDILHHIFSIFPGLVNQIPFQLTVLVALISRNNNPVEHFSSLDSSLQGQGIWVIPLIIIVITQHQCNCVQCGGNKSRVFEILIVQ